MPPAVPLALAVVFVADGLVVVELAAVLFAVFAVAAVPFVAGAVPGAVGAAVVPVAIPPERSVSADRIDCRIEAIEFCPLAVDAAEEPRRWWPPPEPVLPSLSPSLSVGAAAVVVVVVVAAELSFADVSGDGIRESDV
ncbi:hypothetical protein GALL_456970 [mine drainage metagenome]|uniref:Uncharacterized protein n=1 Tax=mine drainage metagenome TaxID=410659 RepID=A0A1J5PME3_9ZZZZ